MKIAVFGYDFQHWKTEIGLLNLCSYGYNPSILLAQPLIPLEVPRRRVNIYPKGRFLNHPIEVAKALGIPYRRGVMHNAEATIRFIRSLEYDIGIILGARILSEEVINSFKYGVINIHPGILPLNRGLDNIQHAILNDLPMGVTSHFINRYIDRGVVILKKQCPIYKEDSFTDITVRMQHLEQQCLIQSLSLIKQGKKFSEQLGTGTYFKYVCPEDESLLLKKFEGYKERWAQDEI